MPARGQKPGQRTAAAGTPMDWAGYVDGLIIQHGSLAAVCERLGGIRGYREDVESVGRALRRLRGRASLSGGAWGERLLRTFGLPQPVAARLRFMGQYHSRFVDLPLPLATDLVQLWDRPPTSESRIGRLWLSLARVTLALRTDDADDAATHLAPAAAVASDDPVGRIEVALCAAMLESRGDPATVPAALESVPALLAQLDGGDAAAGDGDCLRARYVGQVAHALNRAGDVNRALALHLELPDGAATHPFARSRRANGVAYGLFRRGERDAALASARRAATFAGDAGHVRLRAMALLMVARVAGDGAEAGEARARARAIGQALADPILLARCDAADRASHRLAPEGGEADEPKARRERGARDEASAPLPDPLPASRGGGED